MKTLFFYAAVLVVCMRVGWAAEAPEKARELSADDGDEEGRILFGTTGLLTFGNTGNTGTIVIGNAGYIALGAALLVPLIIGLALLFYLYGGPTTRDDSYGYSSGSSSGYSSHARILKE